MEAVRVLDEAAEWAVATRSGGARSVNGTGVRCRGGVVAPLDLGKLAVWE